MNNKTKGTLSSEDIKYINSQYQKRISTGTTTQDKGVVICLDVLGWKNYSRSNQIENLTALTASLEASILDNTLRFSDNKEEHKVEIVNLSDTIFIFISNESDYFFLNIFKALARFINNAFLYSFAFRGAISYGEYKYNKTRNIFTGEAVYEAAAYCESTEWAGIIVTDSLSNELLKENDYDTLEHVHLIRYEDIPFKEKFLDKKTKDSLVLNPNSIFVGERGEYMHNENLEEKYTNYFSNNTGIIPDDLKEKYENTIKFVKHINERSTL